MCFFCLNNIDLKYTSSSVIQQVEVYFSILEVYFKVSEVYLKYGSSILEVYFKYTSEVYFNSSIFEVRKVYFTLVRVNIPGSSICWGYTAF